MNSQKIRVVIAKPGLDGHDRGAKVIARALRDAGMEVIYTGLHQTPEQIVATVVQEDADAVGLSILSGAHMTLVPKVSELLRAEQADDVVLTVGGTIPADDIEEIARTDPDAIRRAHIDPVIGLKGYAVRYLAGHLPAEARPGTEALLPKLWEVLTAADAICSGVCRRPV